MKYLRHACAALFALAFVASSGITAWQCLLWASPAALQRQAADRAPGLLLPNMIYAESLMVEGDYESALERAARVRRPLERETLIHYIQALQCMTAGEWTLAEQHATWLANVTGNDCPAEFLVPIARISARTGDSTTAIRYYYRLAAADNGHLRKQAREALDSLRDAFSPEWETLKQEALAKPDDPNAAGALAAMQMQLFMLEEAAATYEGILAKFGSHPAVHYNLGLVYARQQRHQDAIHQFHTALDGGFIKANVWNNLGLEYKASGSFDQAGIAFRKALETDPNHWHAAYNRGRMLLSTGRKEAARESFLEGLRRAESIGGPAELIRLCIADTQPDGQP